MQPEYPVFVPTKGRYDSRLTIKALEKIGVSFHAVVEPQEYDAYAQYLAPEKILVLPHSDKGLVVTRNWIWDYARDLGVKRFWTFDDNIKAFYRYHNNRQTPLVSGTFLRVMEEFTTRYVNVPVAGMQYYMFIIRRHGHTYPPFVLNTRVYSNMLIETNAVDSRGRPWRNEGFYNDDTDLCLRMLKDGRCTILFNIFLIEKSTTMKVAGGMTPHYQGDGRLKMAQELQRKHPDVTKITRKWGRWQHQVDYRLFKNNRLIRRADVEVPTQPNEFGMVLRPRKTRSRTTRASA